ncbi:MAG: transglutaminase family protein [Aeromicrobium sp.]
MSIKVSLQHRTTYEFDRPVAIGPHVIRLRPAPHSRTPIEAYSLTIEPANHFINWQQDPFGNWLARVVFPEPATKLDIEVGVVADMMVINPFDFFIEEYAETFPFSYEASLKADLGPYLRPIAEADGSSPGPQLSQWLKGLPEIPAGGMPTASFLVDVNAAVYRDINYSVRMEVGVQSPDETLSRRIGSCRDSAWLLVSVLRQYGLAARFVSGYLVQLASDQQSLDGPSGPAQDFTDLHAWAEVFIPGAGWVGLDPTSSLFAGEGHIPLSATPDPANAAPISGITEPCEVTFSFSNTVRRIHEDPRVTLPYTPEQWANIDSLGNHIDERFADGDVRLTMGGEPTFVSIDDMTSPQWTTDADGDDKRAKAGELAERLRNQYAGGGIVLRGQGKWYPGEPLPRWQIALLWRGDGTPMWSDPSLFADPWHADEADEKSEDKAETLVKTIGAKLGLPESQCIPAYEDPLAALAFELRRPNGERPDVDPMSPDAAFVQGLDDSVPTPSAWVLPLVVGDEWLSPAWSFRRGRLVLLSGDSPAGLRLPLDSIAWEDPQPPGEPSYMEAGPSLAVGGHTAEVVDPKQRPTTALAIESRGGFVFVFLPPTERLEDFVDLIALIESAASEQDIKLVLEGYGPPPDTRVTQLVVTPDPGVIEVNVHPTSSWSELATLTDTLYEHARQTRLGTETFDHDGLHGGTGGGNHITLGGVTPAESPMLRRPDLLVSLLTYWQRHPSLSYLFSGRFIGPTSQAPRADEGRPEALYEMEIAFAEIERLSSAEGGGPAPWMIDRALRHLLTDLTGNTHRAEFCIDKLYSPDSSRGRLGLLELRGFEMPPHPQMSLVQALLVRSLVAMFWEKPLSAPLVRWGTELHERFLLPHAVIADIEDVVSDLRAHGIEFDSSWLDPFTEFRFPRIGQTRVAGVDLELRSAIEPWHVLGEEATAGGTARYVDSSVERLQVKAKGFIPGLHMLTCNGIPMPMTGTDAKGEYYAGVRYRAWQPPSALHPSIEVHSPLKFDLVDLSSRTSLGGCVYHVVHPGGRNYDHPPINASEAEARRSRRFEATGHSGGEIDVPALLEAANWSVSNEYPRILDLRRHVPTSWGRS